VTPSLSDSQFLRRRDIEAVARKRLGFRPQLWYALRGYRAADFARDLTAGTTVGIVAVPLAMAFAIASGVRPEAGLITAVVAGFLISALGGSRVQIGGPTGAFVLLVYTIQAKYGLGALLLCTMMAGVILIIMGLTRMGNMIRFIPLPVTTGFTSGIAVLIFSSQIRDFLGLRMESVPPEFVPRMMAFARHLGTTHWMTLAVAAVSLAIVVLWPKRWAKFVPGSMAALVLGTAAAALLHLKVATIGSAFGGIPTALPSFHFPELRWSELERLFPAATTIALLGAIESLLSAVVADGMTGERHDSNQELLAQGIANIVTPMFGGIPATGAIARTATNVKNGARTPVAGVVHALVVLGVMLAAAPLAKYVPLATLSAILIMVAYQMGDWHEFVRLGSLPRSDAAVLLTVFALTVLTDLTVAVEVGMVLAAILFVKRVSDNTQVSVVDESTDTEGLADTMQGKDIPQGVMVFRIFGAFLFGATEKLEEAMWAMGKEEKVLILRLRKVIAMDATGLYAIERLHEDLQERGKTLILSGGQAQPLRVMRRAGFLARMGPENVCPNFDAALARAREVLAEHAKRKAAIKAGAGH
jgi:SulP family sulfate permease